MTHYYIDCFCRELYTLTGVGTGLGGCAQLNIKCGTNSFCIKKKKVYKIGD